MGESIVERPTIENKMGESVPSSATLEVSVSFGRFDNDSLSWEKWSSFSPNKYLEEVEKCSTPGSVAQKKAYFEAHYKKIAARKAEQSDQEKPVGSLPPSSDEPDNKDQSKNTSVADKEFDSSCNVRSAEDVEQDVSTSNVMAGTNLEKEKEVTSVTVDYQDLSIEEAKEESNGVPANLESDLREEAKEESSSSQADLESSAKEEATVVQEETSQNSCQDIVEKPSKVAHAKKTPATKSNSPKLHSRSITQKMIPSRKEQTQAVAKKKVASPAIRSSTATKFSQVSTPRLSKSTIMSASISSTTKANVSSLRKSKTTSPGENKKAVPTALHMSLSLDPVNSGGSFTTARKSLIMEQMGDKEIVKRAFKTFQNRINGVRSSCDGILNGSQQVLHKSSEQKGGTTTSIPQKENGGLRKSAEKINQRGHSGNRSNIVSSGSNMGSRTDRKYATATPPVSLRNDARAERQKEKLEEKLFAREAERAQASGKGKEGKEAQTKNVRQGLNFKSILTPPFNRGKTMSKIPSAKEDKIKTHHQPALKR